MERKTLKQVLMERDGISSQEADAQINEVKKELYIRFHEGGDVFDICEEFFNLEPDYLMDLLH